MTGSQASWDLVHAVERLKVHGEVGSIRSFNIGWPRHDYHVIFLGLRSAGSNAVAQPLFTNGIGISLTQFPAGAFEAPKFVGYELEVTE